DGGSGGDAFNWHSPAFFAFSARFLASGIRHRAVMRVLKNLTVSTEIRIAHHRMSQHNSGEYNQKEKR
ncbi:hypothetical protein ETR_23679, partial [Erwinia tracheiphila PSU-1]|uniref:hypothetical protein n=1 Tax=Erwinia tracheiphila TaxID=65700 RepID=UPI0003359C0E